MQARIRARHFSTGLTAGRIENFLKWYGDALSGADLVDSMTPVRGCSILKPRGYALWEGIRRDLDARISCMGAENVSFPLLVPSSFLAREATHVAGFSSECAVVTHHRLIAGPNGTFIPDPNSSLQEPLVVRPTSEALVWDAFSRWVTSHRDLPVRVNQWANVVRWEMRPRPFLRSSEFLWQEGHTAHAEAKEALDFAASMQDVYAQHLLHALAIPSVSGIKSLSERFAGAEETLTCEIMLPNGWALQGATSHYLGQGFSKAFGCRYQAGESESPRHPYGTSWGASTRLIGALVMVHGDELGCIFPPSVAPQQVVVVALPGGEEAAGLLAKSLVAAGIRTALDSGVGVNSTPGARFYAWEKRGVPLRLEIGGKEVGKEEVCLRDRLGGWLGGDTGRRAMTMNMKKNGGLASDLNPDAVAVSNEVNVRVGSGGRLFSRFPRIYEHPAGSTAQCLQLEAVTRWVKSALGAVQDEMLRRAQEQQLASIVREASYKDLCAVAGSDTSGKATRRGASDETATRGEHGDNFDSAAVHYNPPSKAFLLPWADDPTMEAKVKADTKFTLRCYPHAEQGLARGKVCSVSGREATHMALFSRAF